MGSITVNRRLEGKVAVITGGASGIGASTVRLFHNHGAKVVIADIQDTLSQSLVADLGHNNLSYVHCDVSNEEHVTDLIDTTISKFGHLDIMYNNAGIMNGGFESILTTTKSSVQDMLNVNLVGAFLTAKHAARVMVPNKKGCILFTASCCTEIAGVATHAYTASKYGVVGLMKNLAAELGTHGIRVNCISPFGVLTGSSVVDEVRAARFEKVMDAAANLKGKILKAEDIAMAALYLASDEAAYVSGMNMVVDGGYSVVNPTMLNPRRLL